MRIKLLIYFVARALGLFALCRLLTRSRIRILGYHGACLGDESAYNPYLFISTAAFKRRVDWLLEKGFTVISVDCAVDALNGVAGVGRLPVVVTFDDGWYSTAARLIPILAERNLPSTLYLSTSDFQNGWPILAVTINYVIWKSGRLQIGVEGLDEAIDGSYRLDEKSGRNLFVRKCQEWISIPPTTRENVVERIHRLAGAMGVGEDDLALETRRFDYVSRDELLRLPELGCAVELHGHEHRYAKGCPEVFAADLVACRDVLVGLGFTRPQHYCYPSGNFDDAAAAILENHGVRSATSCIPGLIDPASDGSRRYFLPRFLDGERIGMLVFQAEMSGFADILRRVAGR